MDLRHLENGYGTASVGGGGGAPVTAANNSGPSEAEFQRSAQMIAASIQKIHQNISKMQRMVNHINTPQESSDLKKQLHQIMTYTHQVVSDTHNQFKEIDKCKDRHLKMQRDRLVDEFTTVLTSFQNVQRRTVDVEKNAVRQARANNYKINKPPGSAGNAGFEDSFFSRRSNQQQQQQLQMNEEMDVAALEEQERAIRELENNIVGVNEIYKKLGAMVYEQGANIDSIEAHVEQTSVFVSQGTDNLRKASTYKNKIRRKKAILGAMLGVFLFFLLLWIWLSFKSSN